MSGSHSSSNTVYIVVAIAIGAFVLGFKQAAFFLLFVAALIRFGKDGNSRERKDSTATDFKRIADKYETLEEVTQALRKSGLEGCNLIIGVDFTQSNETQGYRTFGRKCLHHVHEPSPDSVDKNAQLNPYERVVSVIGRTLREFDEDGLIPVFGFGDVTTKGHSVFNFNPDGQPCRGFKEVLSKYREVAKTVCLSGPTNFAPLIRKAIDITKASGGSFHVLLIIADGQVTQPKETVQAIVEASNYPLAIIMVGVGDGPWDEMERYDDELPQRRFDNFQFVNFERTSPYRDSVFAVSALMELPDQFRMARKLNLLGKTK